jgi:glycine/betaine/sarcosine/D-proline reductase family selenoprotein B
MGVPIVQVCSMRQVAEMVGSPRIVIGKSVLHPTGDPSLDESGELALRRHILESALAMLAAGEHSNAA